MTRETAHIFLGPTKYGKMRDLIYYWSKSLKIDRNPSRIGTERNTDVRKKSHRKLNMYCTHIDWQFKWKWYGIDVLWRKWSMCVLAEAVQWAEAKSMYSILYGFRCESRVWLWELHISHPGFAAEAKSMYSRHCTAYAKCHWGNKYVFPLLSLVLFILIKVFWF